MSNYQPLGYGVGIESRRGTFHLNLEFADVTRPGDDKTSWHLRQRAGYGPACSFVGVLTGRTSQSGAHPLKQTEGLKLAYLVAVTDDVTQCLRAGVAPGHDRQVMIRAEHLTKGEQMANAPGGPNRKIN